MRVLHLSDRLSARGGAYRHLLAMLEHQQGRAETLLAYGLDDGSLPPEERGRLGPAVRVKGLERGGLAARGGEAARGRLERLLTQFRPHLVHAHNIMDPGLLAAAAGAGPAVMTVQDHRFFCPGPGKVLPDGRLCREVLGAGCLGCFHEAQWGQGMLALTRARLAALQGMARVLVLSGYMARELIATGLPRDKVAVLPPPVHGLAAPAGARPRAYHLLAGRLVERKGVRLALAAAGMLRTHHVNSYHCITISHGSAAYKLGTCLATVCRHQLPPFLPI